MTTRITIELLACLLLVKLLFAYKISILFLLSLYRNFHKNPQNLWEMEIFILYLYPWIPMSVSRIIYTHTHTKLIRLPSKTEFDHTIFSSLKVALEKQQPNHTIYKMLFADLNIRRWKCSLGSDKQLIFDRCLALWTRDMLAPTKWEKFYSKCWK